MNTEQKQNIATYISEIENQRDIIRDVMFSITEQIDLINEELSKEENKEE